MDWPIDRLLIRLARTGGHHFGPQGLH